MNFFLKPSNYESYIQNGIQKIIKTVDSCTTTDHIETSQKMIDNFIMILLLSDDLNDEDIQFISKQLYLYLHITINKIKTSNNASN
jgi:hypothetical protein